MENILPLMHQYGGMTLTKIYLHDVVASLLKPEAREGGWTEKNKQTTRDLILKTFISSCRSRNTRAIYLRISQAI